MDLGGEFSIGGNFPVRRTGTGPRSSPGPATGSTLPTWMPPKRSYGVSSSSASTTRQRVEMSLRLLAVDRIDLYYLHRIDPKVLLEDPGRQVYGRCAPRT